MCDTVVAVQPGRVLFAKASDRDANEAQLLEWVPRQTHRAGARVRCTWMAIPQVRRTAACVISRPFWMWGAEMGANEHGVVIGNEAVFTRTPAPRQGLLGMDLVRLGLERGHTAAHAVDVITQLLETHGQGGTAGLESADFRYHNSFLVADAQEAWVLETNDRSWAVEHVTSGARAISNGLTIPGFAHQGAPIHTLVAGARRRRACTEAAAAEARGPLDLFAALRTHEGAAPRYRLHNGTLSAPCMHGGGLLAASVTTSAWVSELTPSTQRHWATATAGTCTSLFKPVTLDAPIDLGRPSSRADPSSLWWRHEALHRAVLRDHATLLHLFAPERDALEATWARSPPPSSEAFAIGDARLAEWQARVARQAATDQRPLWARLWWRRRSRLSTT